MQWSNATARRNENHLNLVIWCQLYYIYGNIFTGINFWPVSPLADNLTKILEPLDPSMSRYPPNTCWSPAELDLRTETYITIQPFGFMQFPLVVNMTLQNVIGCQPGNSLPLVTALLKTPNILNLARELETSPVLSIRGCDLISAKIDSDVTKCVLMCHEETNKDISPNGVQGYALRLKSLEALGAAYGVCDITGWTQNCSHKNTFAWRRLRVGVISAPLVNCSLSKLFDLA